LEIININYCLNLAWLAPLRSIKFASLVQFHALSIKIELIDIINLIKTCPNLIEISFTISNELVGRARGLEVSADSKLTKYNRELDCFKQIKAITIEIESFSSLFIEIVNNCLKLNILKIIETLNSFDLIVAQNLSMQMFANKFEQLNEIMIYSKNIYFTNEEILNILEKNSLKKFRLNFHPVLDNLSEFLKNLIIHSKSSIEDIYLKIEKHDMLIKSSHLLDQRLISIDSIFTEMIDSLSLNSSNGLKRLIIASAKPSNIVLYENAYRLNELVNLNVLDLSNIHLHCTESVYKCISELKCIKCFLILF
jgi:hypothetical protein